MREPDAEDLPVEYTDLVPVFHGSHVEVMTLRSALDARGFTTFVPSENTNLMGSFVTGGNSLTLSLVSPATQAKEVLALIEELRPADAEVRMSSPRERRGWWILMLLMYAPMFLVLMLVRLVVRGVRVRTRGPGETSPDDAEAPGASPTE